MSPQLFGWAWCCPDGHDHDGEYQVSSLAVSLLVAVLAISWYVIRRSMRNEEPKSLPGPLGLPLVGSLFSLEPDLHIYFAKLAQVYGPILKLKLGSSYTVVVSSSSLAKEAFKDHDIELSSRVPPVAASILTYGCIDIIWNSCNVGWKTLRKICVHELMSHQNLDSCYHLRRKEVRQTVKDLYGKTGTPIDIGEQVFVTILNVIMGMVWGSTLEGEKRTNVAVEFRQAFSDMVELASKPNISDLFPALRWLDIQGIQGRCKVILSWIDRIFDSIIEQHKKMDKANETVKGNKDFLQFLLELVEQKDAKTPITMIQLKALLMDMVVAGTDTTSTTLEWAMTEMMNNPNIMKKVQEELDEVVGKDTIIEEFHLSKLQYLDAVIKETFRLHPAAPLMLPHLAISSCKIGSYIIPKGARVLFNVWAMHRDPEAWENPLEFRPERFLSGDLQQKCDYRGNNFNYLPFGSGRRVCIGIPLAERMTKYVLATLLHSFEWQLPEGTKLDVSEKFGIVLKKSTPLVAIPTPRLSSHELYNEYESK